ncbi:cytochrome P450 [Actinacidiphila sp. bgisy160]|uniref:cytochrome P450 n=1 Tax=Actinacidiphila sp. bgisy160 TaxID=3413796 RepID=UPI003D7426E8
MTSQPPPGAAGSCPFAGAVPFSGPRFHVEPAALYRELRRDHGALAPVTLDGDIPAWLVLGYRELLHVTGDPVLFSRDSDLWNQWDRIPDDWPLLPMIGRKQPSILYTVGERHRQRAAMMGNAMEDTDAVELRRYAERYSDELVDTFCGSGRADLLEEFAMLLPVRVLARLYGFPEEQGPLLVKAVKDLVDGGPDAIAGQTHVYSAMTELLEAKKEQPGADVVSRMLADRYDFSDEEIVQDLMVMTVAGHQPTADWIGNSLRLMLTDDRFAASFTGGRNSVGQAMNEVLWEDTPTQNIAGRWASRDTRLGGRQIASGDLLILGFAAANADPQVHLEAGASTNGNNAWFSFGHGEHRCPFPAQEIAEAIARTGIEVLLDRLPDLELAVDPAGLVRRPSPWLRGMTKLPVRFTPTPVLGEL